MISVAHVKKKYGPVTALDGVSMTIAKGERVALVGANGSGKTTLLRALLGLVRVEGKVTILGADVAREPEVALRSIAYIPQIAPPIDAPVGEVVRAHAALRGNDVARTTQRALRLGLDVEKCAKKRFRELSGGMKQKLLAAMALAVEAPILVCDEPTANLDGEARASFLEQLAERPSSSVVVLCSHRIEEVRLLVGRVVELKDGRVARDASLSEVMADLHAYRVEVALRDGAASAEDVLRARGFAPCGLGRFGIEVAQAEKIELVTRLLKEQAGDVTDVTIVPVEDIVRERKSAPRLRAVAS
jgi:ABC-2 type transport system ATP-binding protein